MADAFHTRVVEAAAKQLTEEMTKTAIACVSSLKDDAAGYALYVGKYQGLKRALEILTDAEKTEISK